MNRNVLIAEDDTQLRIALRHIMQREGHTVTEAVNGTDTLKKVSEHTFDLILVDIIMPDREGIETILEIRRKHPKLPIIAMSGGARYDAFDPLQLAQDCGANFIIAKPFQPVELREIVKKCWPE
ncbi:MAG: response regulator [Alphaproteobacteria bacterium]|nr:response regulator [Alphaproteobacteria bacterium]